MLREKGIAAVLLLLLKRATLEIFMVKELSGPHAIACCHVFLKLSDFRI